MSIVAISETVGSQGDAIGQALARSRGWQFADREIIARAAERYGEGVMELQHVTQDLLARPAFQGLTLEMTGGYFFAA